MTLDSNALITLANLKTYLKIDDTSHDTQLEQLINSVSTLMLREIDRDLVYTTYTDEYLDGSGEEELYLPEWPIVEITSITENDISLTEGEEEDYTVYAAQGYLRKVSGKWAAGRRNIKITYKAGYWVASEVEGVDEMPKDLQLACMKQVGIEWKRAKAEDWDQTSKTFPDGSISRNITNLHPQIEMVCRKYARMFP